MQLTTRVEHSPLIPARPSYLKFLVLLKLNVLVRKNDYVISENNEGIAEFLCSSLAVFEAFISVNVGVRPKTEKRVPA
ncbi:hypothetical protein BOTU111921_02940 [Bordetella tumbae]